MSNDEAKKSMYKIEIYATQKGKLPFQQWLDDLPDWKTRVAIELRLDRLAMGNFGQGL